ncbi:11124_t:CDS:2 [Cetraspora pellucida]|uniref:11124_t:CDS:1 n=1 Tax=Cetraspora pellucida TaxID=1433469 RepID=A0ACA9LBG3_9GLOM|nr:11124_t:CDS:2 [Cetraspora pellucida]
MPFYVSAYPTGAGTCNVDRMATDGHGKTNIQGFGGYSIATSKSTGQGITLKISGSTGVSAKGVLIYTVDSSGKDTGTIAIPSGGAYKNCAGVNSLTHTSSNSKNLPLSYTWTPSTGFSGNVTVRAIVVQDFSNWVKLQDTVFDSTSGSFTASNNTNVQSGTSGSSGSGVGIGSVTETMLKNQRSKAKYYRTN